MRFAGGILRFREQLVLALILGGLILFFGAISDRFLSAGTFGSIANRIPTLTLAATGMTLVLIAGGIDLSVGSVMALAACVFGVAVADWGWPVWTAIPLAVATGLAVGTLNGWVTVRLRVPSFIVTLGTMEMARGLAFLVAQSQTKYLGGKVEGLASPLPGILLSPLALVAVGVVLAAQLVLSHGVAGRRLLATGANEEAARLSGVATGGVKWMVFAAGGALAGLAAVCQVARLGASDPNSGGGLELAAIAAAVIGGTRLSGGHGSVVNTFLGVLIIATLEAGLAQAGSTEPVKRLVTGLVIVLAVVVDGMRRDRAR
jgi:ribose transport system permease protein